MSRFKRLLLPPEDYSFFLFGPRGTGKSTWVKKHYPDAKYIDLLLAEEMRKYTANPELLKGIAEALPEKSNLIIDEIQKAPELLPVIHYLIEKKLKIQFILTGSSSRKLKREGVDLLAGRAIKKQMHPLMACEMGDAFDLARALRYGMLPLICDQKDQAEILKSYVDLYIVEEVQFEGLVRNIGNFSRFLSTIAFSHGSQLNLNNIARESEVSRSTIINYCEILKDLLLSYEISVFKRRAKRTLASQSKFYLFDSGVFQTLRKMGPMDQKSEIDGAALEGLVMQHLKAWCDYTKGKHEIHFWRTKAGVEVDFVVYGESGFWAIEVKNGSKLSPQDFRGLKNFKQDYPEAEAILLYRGSDIFKEQDIICIPVEKFLKELKPNQPVYR